MNELDFLVRLSINLGHLWNPCDMQRSMIVKYLQFAVDDRASGKHKESDEAMDAATELVKAMIEQRREPDF